MVTDLIVVQMGVTLSSGGVFFTLAHLVGRKVTKFKILVSYLK